MFRVQEVLLDGGGGRLMFRFISGLIRSLIF